MCNICNIIIFYYCEEDIFIYMARKEDAIPIWEKCEITCDEMLIKNIIE